MNRRKALFLLFCASQLCGAAAAQTVTFNQQIAPIIYKNCSSCHRPGEAAPFPLLSYQDVSKRGRLIAAVTASRIMPPWKADTASYPYRDARTLTPAEIALIRTWVDHGMPEGSGAGAPAPPRFSSGWMLGEPDLVVEMPAAYHVPADGPDIYRNIAIPLGLREDKWLTAIDFKPSARAVVHHVLYFDDPKGQAHLKPQQGAEPGFSGMRAGASIEPLGGWAVGAQPHFQPDGLALPVAKGSDLVIQYHFHPTGKPEAERSQIGLYFARQAPSRTLVSIQLPPAFSLFSGLAIPAGEKDYVIRDAFTLPAALDGVSIGAHAHYLGKRLKMTATFPDGTVKTLLNITDWDFAWQDRYFFESLVPLPKDTRLDVEIHWDNSAANPRNPSSPPVRVTWGEQSRDEMGSVTLIGVPHEEKDLGALQRDYRLHWAAMAAKALTDAATRDKIRELLAQ